MKPTLVIGNKNYSSWSLRPWLLLRHFDVPFDEIRVPLNQSDTAEQLAALSPSGKVPVLLHEGRAVWESLAICEYINERFVEGRAWPQDFAARAHARAIACEMHAGFKALRSEWPMNIRLHSHMPLNRHLGADLARIEMIWNECVAISGGPWLYGEFSIADAMYAPVALRFHSYQPPLTDVSRAYVERLIEHRPLAAWMAAARLENEVIKEDEVGFLLGESGWQ